MKAFLYSTMAALALMLGIHYQAEAQVQGGDTYTVVDGYYRYGQSNVSTLEDGSTLTITLDRRYNLNGMGLVDVAGGYTALGSTRADHSNGLCMLNTHAVCFEEDDLGVCSCEPNIQSNPTGPVFRRVTIRRITSLDPPPPPPPPQN